MSEYRKLLLRKLEALKDDAAIHNELEVAAIIQNAADIIKAGNEKDLLYIIAEYSQGDNPTPGAIK